MSLLKKSLLGICALALPATSALALSISQTGQGDAVIVPYFAATDSMQTLVTLYNSREKAKAVKLHVREQNNGRVMASLNIYLAVRATWTAAIFSDPVSGTIRIYSPTTTCSLPDASAAPESGPVGVAFSNQRFSGASADLPSPDPARMREGYLELIEMGELAESDAAFLGMTPSDIETWLQRDCSVVATQWEDLGFWQTGASVLDAPGGGLSVRTSVVDVAEGVAFDIPVTHLAGFSTIAQHTAPASDLPDLGSAVTDSANGNVHTTILDNRGRAIQSTWPQERSIDAVTALLMTTRVENQRNFNPDLGATTDHVLSFPTRRWYTDGAGGGILSAGSQPLPPFAAVADGTPDNPTNGGILSDFTGADGCVGYESILVSHAGLAYQPGCGFLCPGDAHLEVLSCRATQVINYFDPAIAVGEDPIAPETLSGTRHVGGIVTYALTDLPAESRAGLHFGTTGMRPSLEGHIFQGQPALGFAAIRLVNGNAQPGLLAAYAITQPHSREVQCKLADSSPCVTD